LPLAFPTRHGPSSLFTVSSRVNVRAARSTIDKCPPKAPSMRPCRNSLRSLCCKSRSTIHDWPIYTSIDFEADEPFAWCFHTPVRDQIANRKLDGACVDAFHLASLLAGLPVLWSAGLRASFGSQPQQDLPHPPSGNAWTGRLTTSSKGQWELQRARTFLVPPASLRDHQWQWRSHLICWEATTSDCAISLETDSALRTVRFELLAR